MLSYFCFKLIVFSEDNLASQKIKFWAGVIGMIGLYPSIILDISIIIFTILLF